MPRKNEWIVCSKKLPKNNEFVLFCLNTDLKTVYAGWLNKKETTTFDEDMWFADVKGDWFSCDQVLAWYKFPPCRISLTGEIRSRKS